MMKVMKMTHWDFEEAVNENCIEKECPECKTENNIIMITQTALNKIKMLINEFKDLEWGAGLIGRFENTVWVVEDLVIPEQEVGSCRIELTNKGNKELAETKDVIGWMHSHNTMQASHSSVDDANCKMYSISVTVNNELQYDARIKRKLSCGKFSMVEGEVIVESEYKKDDKFINMFKKKITPGVKLWKDGWNESTANWKEETTPFPITVKNGKTNLCHICGNQYGKKGVVCGFCGRVVHPMCLSYHSTTENICSECIENGVEPRANIVPFNADMVYEYR